MPDAAELDELTSKAEVEHAGAVPVIEASSAGEVDLGRPCVIRGAMADWACSTWSRDDIMKHLGHEQVPWRPCFGDWHHRPGRDRLSGWQSVAEYLSSTVPRPGVLFDQDDANLRAHAAFGDFYAVPDILASIHRKRRSTIPMISVGRVNTGVGFHAHAENWLAQVLGRKLWWLVPAGHAFPFEDMPLKQSAPWTYLLPGQHPQGSLFCALNPGDVLYVPESWAHATWNLDDCCISVGHIGLREESAPNEKPTQAPSVIRGNDQQRSTSLMERASTGDIDACFLLGRKFEADGHLASACGWYIKAANGGHAASMYCLWRLRSSHDGSSPMHWLSAAAQHGHADAQITLGDILSQSSESSATAAKGSAASWYAAAAAQRHPGGQHRMSRLHFEAGDTVTGDALLRAAAEQGWADAQMDLGRRAQAAGERVEAQSWYDKAAGQGHPGAMNQLAVLGAQAGDHVSARRWLQAAADRGHRGAMGNLALYLERGVGGAPDSEGAAEWRRLASAK